MNKKVGHWLKAARVKAHLSLHQVAQKTQIDKKILTLVESGELSPTYRDLYKLVRLFKVPPEQLMSLLLDFQAPRKEL